MKIVNHMGGRTLNELNGVAEEWKKLKPKVILAIGAAALIGGLYWGNMSKTHTYNDVSCMKTFCRHTDGGKCFAKFGTSNPLGSHFGPYAELGEDGKMYEPVASVRVGSSNEFSEDSKYSSITVERPNFFGDEKITRFCK